MKKYQVFVSSTYEDLIEERKEVTQALLECGCIPTGMELFPASNKKQWDIIKGVIDDCDYYLLIIAGRYGSTGIDDYGKKVSYTEMEFDYAVQTGKPTIVFVYKDIDKLPGNKLEPSKTGKRNLMKFTQKAKKGRMVAFWDNKDNLKSEVLRSVPSLIETSPALGWIKAGDVFDTASTIKINEGDDYFSGIWHSLNEQDFKDEIELKYNPKTHLLNGKIKRISPDVNKEWKCIGCVVGESIVLVYYSHRRQSLGCGLLRHYHDYVYEGKYLRFDYGPGKIMELKVKMEKVENRDS